MTTKIILLLAVVFMAYGSASAQNPVKIGVVDLQQIITSLPEAQEAQKMLRDLGQKYQDSLMMMQKTLEEKFAGYQKQKGMMAADAQQKAEQEIQAMNQEVLMYREEKFGTNGELQKRNLDIIQPLREKILKAIKEVAAKEKLTLVLDKSGETVLFADEKYDITFTVIDKLKRG